MGLFDGTSLDPADDPTQAIWKSTLREIQSRGLDIQGSLSKSHVKDGATAVVLKAREATSERVVAVKIYKDPAGEVRHRNGRIIPMTNFFENEQKMLAGLQACPLVPRYYYSVAQGDTKEKTQPFHVMEFVEGTRITRFAKESTAKNKAQLVKLFRQVLEAIDSIHQFGFLHRDLSDSNILVDSKGNIRLIDLAESAPKGEDHTRLISTPGLGTEGVTTPEQQKVRKIQADDVRDACTIGYAIFTGQWREPGQGPKEWRRNLQKAGTPAEIASIVVKGMKTRDANQKIDHQVWNTAREVIEAIDRIQARQTIRKKYFQVILGLMLATSLIGTVGYMTWDKIQQFAYTYELKKLASQRADLQRFAPEILSNTRLIELTEAANNLEQQADFFYKTGLPNKGRSLLTQAVEQTLEAVILADQLSRLRPLMSPLRKILSEGEQWNRSCSAINERLIDLGQKHKQIQGHAELGEAESAWDLISSIQPEILLLIEDNQRSQEIKNLLNRFTSELAAIDTALLSSSSFLAIKNNFLEAESHYHQGKWSEAKLQSFAALSSLNKFLTDNETKEQTTLRLSLNRELSSNKESEAEEIRRQVIDLQQRLNNSKMDFQEAILQGAQYKNERDVALKKLDVMNSELAETKKAIVVNEDLANSITKERDNLIQINESLQSKNTELSYELEKLKIKYLESEEKRTDAESIVNSAREMIKSIEEPDTNKPASDNPHDTVLVRFNTTLIDKADAELRNECKEIAKLLSDRLAETIAGKTSEHADITALNDKIETHFQNAVTALKTRDEEDYKAWHTIQAEIDNTHTSDDQSHNGLNKNLANKTDESNAEFFTQLQLHQAGKERFEKNDYASLTPDELRQITLSLPDLSKVKYGSTAYRRVEAPRRSLITRLFAKFTSIFSFWLLFASFIKYTMDRKRDCLTWTEIFGGAGVIATVGVVPSCFIPEFSAWWIGDIVILWSALLSLLFAIGTIRYLHSKGKDPTCAQL